MNQRNDGRWAEHDAIEGEQPGDEPTSEKGSERSPGEDPLAAIRGAQVLKPSAADRASNPRAGKPTQQMPATDDAAERTASPPARRPTERAASVESRLRSADSTTSALPASVSSPRVAMVLSRVLPLAALVAFALSAIVLVTLGVLEEEREQVHGEGDLTVDEEQEVGALVHLEAVTASIGLTADNRESVLSVCFQLSDNPNYECRVSHFRELGEYPAREVAFPAMEVHLREVSNAEYESCVADGACVQRDWDSCSFYTVRGMEVNQRVPSSMRQPVRPAVCLTADEAAAYCEWLDMRLPTADEWERIARGGEDRMQPWGSFWTPALLNWGERDMAGFPVPGRLDGADLTASVFDYEDGATPEGVMNMMGNAAHWVVARENQNEEEPWAARGGSYADDLRTLRITRSVPLRGTERRSTIGFRCVRTLPDP